mgnify:CR=1 FL=1
MFDDAARSFIDEIDARVDAGAKLVWDTAVTLVPVRTGNLKSTIRIEETGQPMERLVRAGGRQAPYAPCVEYGTYKMAAQPYMRPAAEARRPEITKLIREGIKSLFR